MVKQMNDTKHTVASITAVILCGGRGMRLQSETDRKPKPMAQIGGKPILWHIMSGYRAYGVRDFVLCLGYKGSVIRDYFLNFRTHSNDFRIDLADGQVTPLSHNIPDWRVSLIETGETTSTGARLRMAADYVEGDHFFATYGDGVSDVDVGASLDFHLLQSRAGTVTAVRPPSRFGELVVDGSAATRFVEKPAPIAGWINGGYFVFSTAAILAQPDRPDLVLETDVLAGLSAQGQLSSFQHAGYWQCMDTEQELEDLNRIWNAGTPPWKIW
jgi:glucose-1-phosphate cytidylyltransferase